jgi:alanine racemase
MGRGTKDDTVNQPATAADHTGQAAAWPGYPGRAVIDLDAITDNARALNAAAPAAALMAVVKADAYGHGLVPVARAAIVGGATWLGVAQVSEALALRQAGISVDDARILAWLYSPGVDFAALLAADIDVSLSGGWAVDALTAAARASGRRARVHVKIDSGLGRNAFMPDDLPALAARLVALQHEGVIDVVGAWTHLAYADEPGHPTIACQQQVFDAAIDTLRQVGIKPAIRHMANSAATLTAPHLHYDLVRPGIALYGFSPVPQLQPPSTFGLRPAMTLEAELATVKQVPAGTGVSYSHTYTTTTATSLGIVPLGYADGIPRHASGGSSGLGGPVAVGAGEARRLLRVAGRVCMDQIVLDLGEGAPDQAGDLVTLFGASDGVEHGALLPNAEDWAQAAGTISYEIVTRLGVRVPRIYVGGDPQ